jgi:uncharacterized membrane protein
MLTRLTIFRDAIRTSLWVIPALFGFLAFVLAEVLVTIDRELPPELGAPIVFEGGAESARGILTTIAAAMLSFTGLVFTVTMLVLQLASSQLSPRVTRTFLRDRGNQVVLGLFVATFVYALLVLRTIRSGTAAEEFVPGIATWFAFALLLASVAAFVVYIDHMARSIRASSVIASVAGETRAAIQRLFPDEVSDEADAAGTAALPDVSRTIEAGAESGVVVAVDDGALLEIATEAGVILELVPRVGDHVVAGGSLAHVRGTGDVDAGRVQGAVKVGVERSMAQDARFGFRQLVDIATRALSPGINDPTTAVQVLDELHDLLRRLIGRRFPRPERLDDGGRVRIVLPRPDFGEYVDLSLGELRLAGAGMLPVARRMSVLLEDLERAAPAGRLAIVRRHRTLLDAAIERAYEAEADRRAARAVDPMYAEATDDGSIEAPGSG